MQERKGVSSVRKWVIRPDYVHKINPRLGPIPQLNKRLNRNKAVHYVEQSPRSKGGQACSIPSCPSGEHVFHKNHKEFVPVYCCPKEGCSFRAF